MSLSFKQLRTAISDQIDTLSGFRLIKLPPAQFGRSQQTLAHLGYSVGLETSEQLNERQRRINGGYYVQTNQYFHQAIHYTTEKNHFHF